MECILHIGTEKTGTTLLQDWMYDNINELGENGVYLSRNLEFPNNRLLPSYFQGHLDEWAFQKKITTQALKQEFFDGFVERFRSEVEEVSGRFSHFIITSEHFHSRLIKKDEIRNLFEVLNSCFEKVKVICYFRNQFDVAVSLYSTALKSGLSATLDEFLDRATPDNYYYNYLRIADQWSDVFGARNCDFRVFNPKSFLEGDLRKDFIKAAAPSLNLENLNYLRNRANESLTSFQAAAFRAVNAKVPYWRDGMAGINERNLTLQGTFLGLEELKIGKISSHRRDEVEKKFRIVNELFFKQHFQSDNLFHKTQSREEAAAQKTTSCECAIEAALRATLSSHTRLLSEGRINFVRDLALKIKSGQPLNANDALELMKVALVARPEGAFIRDKVAEWSEDISGKKK